MTPEEFRKNNELTYDEYKRVRETYPHIASFAYWPNGYYISEVQRKIMQNIEIPIVAKSEEDFNARLLGNVQKGVIILGLNYGDRSYTPANNVLKDEKLSVTDRLKKLTAYYDLQNQYAGNNQSKAFPSEFVTHNGHTSVLSGAYMTDLFKFNADENGKWLATGMATKDAGMLIDYLKEHPEAVDYNIQGLQHELHEVLGAGEQIVFILLGGKVQHYAPSIQKAFPQALLFNYTHYAAWQTPKEAFAAEANKLNDAVEAAIAKW